MRLMQANTPRGLPLAAVHRLLNERLPHFNQKRIDDAVPGIVPCRVGAILEDAVTHEKSLTVESALFQDSVLEDMVQGLHDDRKKEQAVEKERRHDLN